MNETACILVVDDDRLTAELMAFALEGAGFRVTLAEGGVDALERLGEDPGIGAVVSDLHMPLLNGVELFQEMRSHGFGQPFVLLSAQDHPSPLLEHPGLAAVLRKDADLIETLPGTLARLLDARA
jgi:CheY-like chemotaxis protein